MSKASEESQFNRVFLSGGMRRGFRQRPPYIVTTNDGTLCRHQKPFRGLHPMEVLPGLHQKRGHTHHNHKLEMGRKMDNGKGLAHRTQKDRKPCWAWRRSLYLHRSSDPDPLVLFHPILS